MTALSQLALSPVNTDGISLLPELEPGAIAVRLKRNADSTANDAFASFVTKLHSEAQRLGVQKVRLDLTELYFMTSSSIRCFVTWIGFIREAPTSRRYALKFRREPEPALRRGATSTFWFS